MHTDRVNSSAFLHRRLILRFIGTHGQPIKTSSDVKSRENNGTKGTQLFLRQRFEFLFIRGRTRTYDRLECLVREIKNASVACRERLRETCERLRREPRA